MYMVIYTYIYGKLELQGVPTMSHVSYTDLRANLATYMEAVCDSRDALVVTRQNARSVVLLSEDEYESMMETLHLLRSPANAARLFRSIEEAAAGNLEEHALIDEEPTHSA
jgi:antitoxin YefM